MKRFLSSNTGSVAHLHSSDDNKENVCANLTHLTSSSEQHLPSRPRSATTTVHTSDVSNTGLTTKWGRAPDTPGIHYRGIRSLKHKHDKNYAEGLRKSSSIHDIPSASSNSPDVTTPTARQPRLTPTRAQRRRTVSADVTLLDQSFDLTHVTTLSTANFSSDLSHFSSPLLANTPTTMTSPSTCTSTTTPVRTTPVKMTSALEAERSAGAVVVHARNLDSCDCNAVNNNNDISNNSSRISCVASMCSSTIIDSPLNSSMPRPKSNQCVTPDVTDASHPPNTDTTNPSHTLPSPCTSLYSAEPIKTTPNKQHRPIERRLPKIPIAALNGGCAARVTGAGHVSRVASRIPRVATPSSRKLPVPVTSSLARIEMHNKVATVARIWELRSQSSGRNSPDVTQPTFGLDFRLKSSKCDAPPRARSAPPVVTNQLQLMTSSHTDVTLNDDDVTAARYRSPSPACIVIKADELHDTTPAEGDVMHACSLANNNNKNAPPPLENTSCDVTDHSPSNIITWQVQNGSDRPSPCATSGSRVRRKLPVPVLSAAKLATIKLPESVLKTLSMEDDVTKNKVDSTPEVHVPTQPVPNVLVTSEATTATKVQV